MKPCTAQRTALLLLAMLLLLINGSCAARPRRFQAVFTDLFDTVTVLTAYAGSEEEFEQLSRTVHRELEECHRLFDIYHEYPDTVNLCTLNARGHGEALQVDIRILEMLEAALSLSRQSGGKMSPTMGSVLRLWHQARTQGLSAPDRAALPSPEALEAAAEHMDPSDLILDRDAGTVRLADPALLLDVGGIAKGWAAQHLCRLLEAQGYDSVLLSIGGNVSAVGSKGDGSPWLVAVEDPAGNGYLATLQLRDMSAVTSGTYQRFYTVDGRDYHHIIDPDTLYPAEGYRLITVLHRDAGTADALSTALFNMSREEGEAFARSLDAEVLWQFADGDLAMTEGFQTFLQK